MSHQLKLGEVKIGNQTYTLIGVPDLTEGMTNNDDPLLTAVQKKVDESGSDITHDHLYGVNFFHHGIIKFDSNTHPALIDETLIHETLEAVKNTMSDCDFTELQMDVIARHIIQLLHQFDFSFVDAFEPNGSSEDQEPREQDESDNRTQ